MSAQYPKHDAATVLPVQSRSLSVLPGKSLVRFYHKPTALGPLPPVHTVPPEILTIIFIEYITALYSELSVRRPSIIPLVLTHVCQFWRAVALATPELWRYVELEVPNVANVERFFRYTDYARSLIDRARVGGSVELNVRDRRRPVDGKYPLCGNILEVMYGDWEEIRSVVLRLPLEHLIHLLPRVYCQNDERDRYCLLEDVVLHATDDECSYDPQVLPLDAMNLPWEQLKTLHIPRMVIPYRSLQRVLARCESIIAATFHVEDERHDDGRPDNMVLGQDYSSSPSALGQLQSLDMTFGDVMCNIFENLAMPNLESLNIRFAEYDSDTSILPLLELQAYSSFSKLTTFSLSNVSPSSLEMIQLLRGMPALTALALDYCWALCDTEAREEVLDAMTVEHPDPSSTYPPDASKLILPNLRKLSFLMWSNESVDGIPWTEMHGMLRSRWWASDDGQDRKTIEGDVSVARLDEVTLSGCVVDAHVWHAEMVSELVKEGMSVAIVR